MGESQQPVKIEINGWHFRVKEPSEITQNTRVMLLLHGYQGNENVMWVLTKPLPDDYVLIAPRAPIKTGENQFVWHEIAPQWPKIQTYQPVIDHMLSSIDQWLEAEKFHLRKFDLMGFSQGAVLAYALTFLKPDRICRVAALAGFIPHDWQDPIKRSILKGRQFFIAHGTRDDIIPINKGRHAADWLEENGAQVTFCTADIGHKLSANCFSGLGEFFT